ncbi:hypothetical protein SRDD_31640 [Serratia sp. DD3]|nr:hypothetical protein SRDD_31640 [Serratia sp. DD3]
MVEGGDLLTQRLDQLAPRRVIQLPITAEETQHHHTVETGQHRAVRGRLMQHIAHAVAQGIPRFQRPEKMTLQRHVVPLYAGIILHPAPLDHFVNQRALGIQDMLAIGLAITGLFQRLLDLFNVRHTAFPQYSPFPFLKLGAMAQANHLQPGVLQQRVNITLFYLTHIVIYTQVQSSCR